MQCNRLRILSLALLVSSLALAGCGGGTDGAPGQNGQDGQDGGSAINASQVSDEFLDGLTVMSQVTNVMVASPPVVTFTLATDTGVPITGIVPFWNDDDSFVRFTMTKLVEGTGGDPDRWVSYTRDSVTNDPDYDKGSSLVDNGDGSYDFTFNTDVTMVPGVLWEPTLTTRVAGQIGDRDVPLEPQNMVYDYVPAGGPLPLTHDVATMDSCNECHDNLVFHGRRFEVEYCVQCHNADLAMGEADFSFMIHKIHSAGMFTVLGSRGGTRPAADFSELTYPQDLRNCRKCHNGADGATPDGDNWKTVPNIASCDACHENFTNNTHTGGPQANNAGCAGCHMPQAIEDFHTLPNLTPNNPQLLPGQREIVYELVSAAVGMANEVIIEFRILSDGTPLDTTMLPADLTTNSFPTFLLAWAMPQDGIAEPQDYNNMGRRAAQPISVGLQTFSPIAMGGMDTLTFDAGSGNNTATINTGGLQFPMGATLRAIGLQDYFHQLIGADTVALHTASDVIEVTGDDARRTIVDSNACAKCHEFFEGHGGNRNHNMQICTLCHVPNLSSSGRTVIDPTARGLDADLAAAVLAGTLDSSVNPADPLTYPEDAQNFKDLIHSIHSEGERTRHYQHVRGPGRQGYYDWAHITFPRGASTSNCSLCHEDGTTELPLMADLLPSTVRTTLAPNGLDMPPNADPAFVSVPNSTDWINTPVASSCFGCHTSVAAQAHMMQNGALLSDPSLPLGPNYSNRSLFGSTFESCSVCHGPGSTADIELVHNK